MQSLIKTESEFTATGAKKIYDIFEKERSTPSHPRHHIHSYYELILVTQGELSFQIELGKPSLLQTGDVLFVPPFVPHATYRTVNAPMRCTVVKFSPTYLYPAEVTPSDLNCLLVEPNYKQSHYLFRHDIKSTERLSRLMTEALDEVTERPVGYEISLRAYLSSLYVWLLRNCDIETNRQTNHATSPDQSKTLRNVLHFLANNYQNKISMAEVARMCNMSYPTFSVFFKRTMGKNFNEYLLDLRLNYAQKMLLSGEKNISEIASDCGFEYVSYFIRQFKAEYGMTPKQYKKIYLSASHPESEKRVEHNSGHSLLSQKNLQKSEKPG